MSELTPAFGFQRPFESAPEPGPESQRQATAEFHQLFDRLMSKHKPAVMHHQGRFGDSGYLRLIGQSSQGQFWLDVFESNHDFSSLIGGSSQSTKSRAIILEDLAGNESWYSWSWKPDAVVWRLDISAGDQSIELHDQEPGPQAAPAEGQPEDGAEVIALRPGQTSPPANRPDWPVSLGEIASLRQTLKQANLRLAPQTEPLPWPDFIEDFDSRPAPEADQQQQAAGEFNRLLDDLEEARPGGIAPARSLDLKIWAGDQRFGLGIEEGALVDSNELRDSEDYSRAISLDNPTPDYWCWRLGRDGVVRRLDISLVDDERRELAREARLERWGAAPVSADWGRDFSQLSPEQQAQLGRNLVAIFKDHQVEQADDRLVEDSGINNQPVTVDEIIGLRRFLAGARGESGPLLPPDSGGGNS